MQNTQNNANNQYIQDYKEETKVSQYKTSGIGNIYVAIDRRDNSVIYSVGKIDDATRAVEDKEFREKLYKEYGITGSVEKTS